MKETKIERAIYDTKLRLAHAEQEIMLLIRERDTLKTQLDTLQILLADDKNFDA